MKINIKSFSELTTEELYEILKIRSEIFVVEQECIYQDLDGKDEKALHVFGIKSNEIIVYARIFKPGSYFTNASIGRILVSINQRKKGYAHILLKECIKVIETHFNTTKITISAQKHLLNFYNSRGFKKVGKEYLEDGIPHIKMIKQ